MTELLAVHLKLSQHCCSAILQHKIKVKGDAVSTAKEVQDITPVLGDFIC